jgi:hypothetical protein
LPVKLSRTGACSPTLAAVRLTTSCTRKTPSTTKDNNEGYQGSGFGYQVLGGVHFWLTRHVGLFVETKFNSGNAKVDTADQGKAETSLDTFQVLGGVSLGF